VFGILKPIPGKVKTTKRDICTLPALGKKINQENRARVVFKFMEKCK
jgi:hypothetical protein